MNIREKYEKLLHKNLKNAYLNELGLQDYEERIKRRLVRDRGKQISRLLSKHYNVKGKTILEVGAGWGEISVELARKGAVVVGIEPDEEKIEISRLLAKIEKQDVKFTKGVGEELPYPDNHFEFVVCSTVLEHVDDPKKTLSEMIRVLKEDGVLYLNTPNYLVPYERHYKTFYPAMFPKSLVKLYLKMIDRPTNYIDHIKYITQHFVSRELKKYPVKSKNIWREKFRNDLKDYGLPERIAGKIILALGIDLSVELFITKLTS